MTRYAHQLLMDCLIANGFPPDQAEMAVNGIMETALRAEIIERRHLDVWEIHASIYHLRGKDVRPVELSVRFSMARSKIFDAIRRHAKRRRAALRHGEDGLDLAVLPPRTLAGSVAI